MTAAAALEAANKAAPVKPASSYSSFNKTPSTTSFVPHAYHSWSPVHRSCPEEKSPGKASLPPVQWSPVHRSCPEEKSPGKASLPPEPSSPVHRSCPEERSRDTE
ncbi:uncharacterized protein IUM83_11640 [Phytophthora cinnamomi]|uniref:uncharacterized protein n=1 Tax=Phytophthora cinnamomi TaxID=4785 RepID=UPI003559D2F3|nr:hypothetical protein IUM83_11640 [Phytophthora cinnamomi]